MKNKSLCLSILAVILCAGISLADASPDNENAVLKARIDKLEKELAELKQIVKQQEENKIKSEQAPKAQPAAPAVEVAPAPVAPEKKPVLSNLDVQVYGRLKADAAVSTDRVDTGNFVKWVRPDRGNNDHTQFDLTANESRLGMWIFGPKDRQLQTSGRVEIDFFDLV